MKQIKTKDELTNLFLDAAYQLTPEEAEEIQKQFRFVVNQLKLGAGTFGELALKNRQDEFESMMPLCPRCNSSKTVKNGPSRSGNQRYTCKECGKSFMDTSNSIGSKVTQNVGKWMLFIQCLLNGETIKATAIMCDISEKTALDWRLRVFETLEHLAKDVQLSGVIAADDTRVRYNLKGNHGSHFVMPRNARKRGGQDTVKTYQRNQICVLCAIDRQGRSFSRCVGFGKPSGKRLVNGFAGKLNINNDTVLVSDGDKAYGMVVRKYNLPRWEIRISEKKGTKRYPAVVDDIHLNKINAYHSRLKTLLEPAHGMASRYLPGTLLLFDYLENNRGRSVDDMAIEIMSAMSKNGSKTTVEELKQKYSIPVSNGPEKYTWELKIPAKEQAIYRDWVNKMPAKEVAAKHHIYPKKIYWIRDKVKKYGVHDAIMNLERESDDTAPNQPKQFSDRDWGIFKRYYRDGETLKAIAKDFGISYQAIHKIVRKILRTPEGAALANGWKKAKTRTKKKGLPKEKILREVNLVYGPKTSMNAAYAIVAEANDCRKRSVSHLHYEQRCKTGNLCENYRWKKERKQMQKEEYNAFLQERNAKLYADVNAYIERFPSHSKKDAFLYLAERLDLSADRVMHIYYEERNERLSA